MGNRIHVSLCSQICDIKFRILGITMFGDMIPNKLSVAKFQRTRINTDNILNTQYVRILLNQNTKNKRRKIYK